MTSSGTTSEVSVVGLEFSSLLSSTGFSMVSPASLTLSGLYSSPGCARFHTCSL